MEPVGHHGQNTHFQGQTRPGAGKPPILLIFSTRFIGDPKFRRHFCQKFTWTSIKTIAMEPVCCRGHNGPFSKSHKPRSSPQDLLVTQNFDVIFAKILHRPP
ncbi:hypothetical protein H5410_019318 [Solanum commersonii]|uniref:Uncharacterized protein n=1 Tax=Solanum commersonii TaxID=4109 RepID=A0A9J5Z722_SOLCO|nr:hypothetical protein H5410_019318 [Solanum commersonii]